MCLGGLCVLLSLAVPSVRQVTRTVVRELVKLGLGTEKVSFSAAKSIKRSGTVLMIVSGLLMTFDTIIGTAECVFGIFSNAALKAIGEPERRCFVFILDSPTVETCNAAGLIANINLFIVLPLIMSWWLSLRLPRNRRRARYALPDLTACHLHPRARDQRAHAGRGQRAQRVRQPARDLQPTRAADRCVAPQQAAGGGQARRRRRY